MRRRSEQEIIAEQSRRWELDRALMRRVAEDEAKTVTRFPVITISRGMGSGGVTTGQLVAQTLGFAFYDKQILERVALETGARAEHLSGYDEGTRGTVSSMMLNFLDRRNVADTVYLRSLHRVLKEIAHKGSAVIIGRGGQCVLPEAIKIRLVAPFELRVQRMAMVRNVSEHEAEAIVLESDHAKRRFLKHFFGCSPTDALLYDLVINTGTLSLDHAAELIVARVRQTWKEA